MSKVKRFFATAGIYMIGNVLSRLMGFLLLPLYTGRLAPDQFGMFDLVVTVITLSVPIVFFQIWDGMFRFAFEKCESKEKYGVISNSFFVWGAGFIIYFIIFSVLYKVLRFEHAGLIFLYGTAVALQYQYVFIARAFLKNKVFVISGLLNSFFTAIINIVLILKFNMGIESLYIAPVVGSISQVLVIGAVLHPLKHFDPRDIKINKVIEMVKFSVPLCFATVLYWLLSGCTKIAISQQLGTYANGLYAVANRFCSMMTFLITVFQYAWYELAYFLAADGNRGAKYEKIVEYIARVTLLGSGVFMLFFKLVFPYLVDSSYHEALMIMPLSLLSVAVNAFASFIDTIFMAEKQTSWIFKTTVIGAGINIGALWVFTPVWGLQGAIGALCLAFTILAFFRMYILAKRFYIRLHWSNSLYLLLLAAVIFLFYAVSNTICLILVTAALCGISAYFLRDILIPLWRSISIKKVDKEKRTLGVSGYEPKIF